MWNELYNLKKLDSAYVAQGIEIYHDFLFFTVHKQDQESLLIVFKITKKKSLKHLFTTSFPKIATHVSDLSVYKQSLYAIDYTSHNLYKINLDKTITLQKLVIENTVQTHLSRSGSIIVTSYQNQEIILISQFMISKKIKAFLLKDLPKENKDALFEIESKYFIQGLYKNNGYIYISSNKQDIDPIFRIHEKTLFNSKTLENKDTLVYNGPGRMVEDIVVYDNHIITSDEENNKIYISNEKITNQR
jgi:hypothetical protein